jgi:hypothetical protein
MKRKASGEELLPVARRALAFAYAALDKPTRVRVRDARNLVVKVLAAMDRRLLGGEGAELVAALERVAAALTGLEAATA